MEGLSSTNMLGKHKDSLRIGCYRDMQNGGEACFVGCVEGEDRNC